ncbi:hypothetical protein [Pelagicoccus sp. SDUM812005]|uniref:hypothetical protein n=1 Tax=Pelagicoccus sp. SDUM812005 TaxID=3041257 RepID=UPI00280E5D10|nr:hypothetical protein [Pelagicoccus sp. SDUM812005]MDQ8182442.1 hypothetical protein [Pelagicoccus sp. SDUM812005]
MNEPDTNTDWQNGTWTGSRLEQLKRWRALPLKAKLDALDDLLSFSGKMLQARQAKGLPYATNPQVASTAAVSEAPSKYHEHRDQQS